MRCRPTGEKAGLEQITVDFSLRPIRGESGEVEYLLPEGRNIIERKQAENEVVRQAEELRVLNERLKELDRIETQFFANEARLRAEAELERLRLQELLAQAPAAIGLMTGADHHWVYINEE
jgi:PAS domain-containing protein